MTWSMKMAKRSFFDRAAVVDKIARAEARVLSRGGAFVRTRARRSIRKKKGASPPGSPPHSHVGTLRRGIMFGYDKARHSVVIGPVLLGSQTGAPRALERGGQATVNYASGPRAVRILPRPYMAPALEAERAGIVQGFRDMIK